MMSQASTPLSPLTFFGVKVSCPYLGKGKRFSPDHELPTTTVLSGEEPFSDVSMGWNEEGLFFRVVVDEPVGRCQYPKVENGDSVEIFVDTRDVKTAGFPTKYCHHFFFLPEEVDGHRAGEITRFRTQDAHELCHPQDLIVKTQGTKHAYSLEIFIPAHCLVGYDPSQCDHIGFTYRINRAGGSPQHFSVTSAEFSIAEQPALWASVSLVKK